MARTKLEIEKQISSLCHRVFAMTVLLAAVVVVPSHFLVESIAKALRHQHFLALLRRVQNLFEVGRPTEHDEP